MNANQRRVPVPKLKIIPLKNIHPHEESDPQRSVPLIEKIREATVFTNPPIVTAIENDQYVILDGSNRCTSFMILGYDHILVQIVDYDDGNVELDVWQHVISGCDIDTFLRVLKNNSTLITTEKPGTRQIAKIIFKDQQEAGIFASDKNIHKRNTILRELVHIYHENATLYRTALTDIEQIWELYPQSIAYIKFPVYTPNDIIEAGRQQAFLPAGISRHIIHGRVLKANYPLEHLKDNSLTLEEKNKQFQDWFQAKLAQKQVRYYAEGTYQFDE
ncbi:hypothetical protein MASR2M15_20070 [Anaerolineales bacterium]